MLTAISSKAQHIVNNDHFGNASYTFKVITDSGYKYISFVRGTCKAFYSYTESVLFTKKPEFSKIAKITPGEIIDNSPSLLKAKGYISYEYYYNERVDTPYTASSLQQHTVSGQVQLTLNDRYPFNLSFSTRRTNNPFFKNIFDMGVLFDKNSFIQLQKERYLKKLSLNQPLEKLIKDINDSIKKYETDYNTLTSHLDERTIVQAIVREREQLLLNKLKKDMPAYIVKDSIVKIKVFKGKDIEIKLPGDTLWSKENERFAKLKDSIAKTPTEKWYDEQVRKLSRLKESKLKLEHDSDSLRNVIQVEQQNAEGAFRDKDKLKKYRKKYGDRPELKEDKFTAILQNIKSVGIGRANIDYSELTVHNLNLTGLQLEYQPNLYYAIAGGKIDYSFRDFFLSNNPLPSQQFYIARIGMVREDKSSLIFSTFSGKKNTFVLNNTSQNNFMGYSVEGKIHISNENYIEGEIAKTTPSVGTINPGKQATLFGFKNNDNLGLVAKAHFKLLQTHTLLDLDYRKLGYSFQSINLFTNNLNQTAWSAKVEQTFLKNALKLTAMLRKNDFTYPSVVQNFNTNSIFKTIKLGFHKKALFFNIGYFPGTQLIRLDSGKIAENLYYMFNTTGGYSKKIGSIYFSTVANYNVFVNQSTDTGFVFYRGKSLQLNQSFIANTITMQTGFTITNQPEINYYVIESSVQVAKLKWLSIGTGVKYNKVIDGTDYWSGSGNVRITISHFLTLDANYDQLFIPAKNNQLIKSDLGRITLTKYF